MSRKIIAGLSFQFGVLMSAILVISMLLAASLSYRENTQIAEETLNARLESTGHLLAAISVEPLLTFDFFTINEEMQITSRQKNVVFAQLSGIKSESISLHFNNDSIIIKNIKDNTALHSQTDILKALLQHPDIIWKTYPVTIEGKTLGNVSLGLDRREYDKAANNRFKQSILLSILIAAFAGFSIYLIFNRRVLTPVKRLKAGASRVANFELDKKINIDGHNELSDLANSFNDMTLHLSEAITDRNRTMDELRSLNETLEERIHERTQELQQLNNKVTHQAMHDPLTNLPNRSLIMERLKHSIHYAHRHNKTLSVFMMDLNRFKEVNDTLGHPVGDKVLIEVSKRLPKVLRETDTFGRLGGDEFVVILSESSLEQAMLVAGKIQQEFVPDFEIDGHLLSISTSIGIALFPEHADDPDSLIQKADIALYVAKKKHERQIAIYDEAEDHHTLSRLLLVSDLKEAIEKEQLELYFQPLIDLTTGKVNGLEALTRWHHPQQGYISPEIFIPMAEDSGLIKPLTDFVLKCVARQLSDWQLTGLKIRIAVNLSIGNLLDPGLTRRFAELMKKYHVPSGLLKLEITESMIMSDPDRVIETLLDPVFKDAHISIDDFGTGYSSLNHLKRLPVNEIKVDKSFVDDMLDDPDDLSIVQSIIDLSKSLKLKVVAEGVENIETAQQLRIMGCDFAQGYYYSEPVPASQIKELVNSINSSALQAAAQLTG